LDAADKCFTCGEPLIAPNVRAAGSDDEKVALTGRYEKAMQHVAANGLHRELEEFTKLLRSSYAVINVDINFLFSFFSNDKALYASYSLGVRGQSRRPAKGENDRQRLAVEGLLFGSYGDQIRYAALSLDHAGVKSYGDFSMKLREVAIDKRSSLLEDNSFVFVAKHDVQSGKSIPKGYRSAWSERDKLAVAKLADRITSTTTETEYSAILLFSDGKYETDDFIEVHIYGPFDAFAIESVAGNSVLKDDAKRAMVQFVKEQLTASGKAWVEQ
jgi:hypothetical protein